MISPFLHAAARDAAARLDLEQHGGVLSASTLQLIVSPFYEGLRAELEKAREPALKGRLAAALDQCRRAAEGKSDPEVMLAELHAALAMLQWETPPVRQRPMLRLIPGGIS